MHKPAASISAGLALVLSCNLVFMGLIGPVPDFDFYQENGALENLQVLLLALCCGVLILLQFRCTDATQRITLLSALLLVFTFLVRESDLRPYGVSPFITYFSDGEGRYWLLGPLWLALTVVVTRHPEAKHWMCRQLLHSRIGVLLLISAGLLFVGILLDKSVLRIIPSRFYEELLELNAYAFLLVAALEQRKYRAALV